VPTVPAGQSMESSPPVVPDQDCPVSTLPAPSAAINVTTVARSVVTATCISLPSVTPTAPSVTVTTVSTTPVTTVTPVKALCPIVARKMFCDHLFRRFPRTDFPDLVGVIGKEWDTKAKLYLRKQVKSMIESKELCLTYRDLQSWNLEDVSEGCNVMCDILSVRNYLYEYILGL